MVRKHAPQASTGPDPCFNSRIQRLPRFLTKQNKTKRDRKRRDGKSLLTANLAARDRDVGVELAGQARHGVTLPCPRANLIDRKDKEAAESQVRCKQV